MFYCLLIMTLCLSLLDQTERANALGRGVALLIRAVLVVEIAEKSEHFHIYLLSTV